MRNDVRTTLGSSQLGPESEVGRGTCSAPPGTAGSSWRFVWLLLKFASSPHSWGPSPAQSWVTRLNPQKRNHSRVSQGQAVPRPGELCPLLLRGSVAPWAPLDPLLLKATSSLPSLPSIPGTMWGKGSLGVAITTISQRFLVFLKPLAFDSWPIPVRSPHGPHYNFSLFFLNPKYKYRPVVACLQLPSWLLAA